VQYIRFDLFPVQSKHHYAYSKEGNMRDSSIFWGVVLVLLGGLLLAQTTGLLPSTVNVWAIFWSLALVALGAGLLLRSMRGPGPRDSVQEPLQGARTAEVRFQHGAGELLVDASAGAEDVLQGDFGGGVETRVRRSGDQVSVELRPRMDSFPFFSFYGRGDMDWKVGLNPHIPLDLRFEVGASRNRLRLRDLQVRSFSLETGASATEIEFPAAAGATRARIRSGAASVDMRIPDGVAARIHASGGMASIDVDTNRFPRVGSEYRSPDYDTAVNRLDLDVETGVGSVSIR
jgi:hypothetical protein